MPVRWGVEHEKDALSDYLVLQSAITNIRVEDSGLTLYPSMAFLGATSDGWVYDESMPEGNSKGVLEIKCPYSINNEVITSREVNAIDISQIFKLHVTYINALLSTPIYWLSFFRCMN